MVMLQIVNRHCVIPLLNLNEIGMWKIAINVLEIESAAKDQPNY